MPRCDCGPLPCLVQGAVGRMKQGFESRHAHARGANPTLAVTLSGPRAHQRAGGNIPEPISISENRGRAGSPECCRQRVDGARGPLQRNGQCRVCGRERGHADSKPCFHAADSALTRPRQRAAIARGMVTATGSEACGGVARADRSLALVKQFVDPSLQLPLLVSLLRSRSRYRRPARTASPP